MGEETEAGAMVTDEDAELKVLRLAAAARSLVESKAVTGRVTDIAAVDPSFEWTMLPAGSAAGDDPPVDGAAATGTPTVTEARPGSTPASPDAGALTSTQSLLDAAFAAPLPRGDVEFNGACDAAPDGTARADTSAKLIGAGSTFLGLDAAFRAGDADAEPGAALGPSAGDLLLRIVEAAANRSACAVIGSRSIACSNDNGSRISAAVPGGRFRLAGPTRGDMRGDMCGDGRI